MEVVFELCSTLAKPSSNFKTYSFSRSYCIEGLCMLFSFGKEWSRNVLSLFILLFGVIGLLWEVYNKKTDELVVMVSIFYILTSQLAISIDYGNIFQFSGNIASAPTKYYQEFSKQQKICKYLILVILYSISLLLGGIILSTGNNIEYFTRIFLVVCIVCQVFECLIIIIALFLLLFVTAAYFEVFYSVSNKNIIRRKTILTYNRLNSMIQLTIGDMEEFFLEERKF